MQSLLHSHERPVCLISNIAHKYLAGYFKTISRGLFLNKKEPLPPLEMFSMDVLSGLTLLGYSPSSVTEPRPHGPFRVVNDLEQAPARFIIVFI